MKIPTIPVALVFVLSLLATTRVPATEPEGKTISGAVREGVRRIELLPPGPENPRNSEGDFIRLKDGRVLLVYTHFTGGAGDHAGAYLAGRYSHDAGKSWSTQDVVILPNEGGRNIMSVSLLRLNDGRIALFYLRKNSLTDCRPVMRISRDEAKTWGEPIEIIPDREVGYYVLNNDRVIQLENGRLVIPLAQHHGSDWKKWTPYAQIVCYVSDDAGKSWQRGQTAPESDQTNVKRVMLQEPGVVELKAGRLMLWCRTDAGSQYVAYSQDQGKTWTQPKPSNILSPRSPASIERIPSTGDLLLVWNDHRNIPANLQGKRTPLCAAISSDEGQTWRNLKILENNPNGWYCYTAIAFVENQVLLAYCAGDREKTNGLALTQITRFPLTWIYKKTKPSPSR